MKSLSVIYCPDDSIHNSPIVIHSTLSAPNTSASRKSFLSPLPFHVRSRFKIQASRNRSWCWWISIIISLLIPVLEYGRREITNINEAACSTTSPNNPSTQTRKPEPRWKMRHTSAPTQNYDVLSQRRDASVKCFWFHSEKFSKQANFWVFLAHHKTKHSRS